MTSAPAELRTLRPYRHRFPVLRSIPTTRHASLLPSPWAISCTYRRCFSACTPPACVRRLLRIATSRNRSVLRRQLASAPPDPAPPAAAPTSAGPYLRLATACYPFTLPFNEPIAVARTYLDWLQSSRNDVLATFQTDPTSASAAVDAELLEIDPYLFELLTGTTLDG